MQGREKPSRYEKGRWLIRSARGNAVAGGKEEQISGVFREVCRGGQSCGALRTLAVCLVVEGLMNQSHQALMLPAV